MKGRGLVATRGIEERRSSYQQQRGPPFDDTPPGRGPTAGHDRVIHAQLVA